MRFNLTRDFFIPKHSIKVSHRLSDAVAYIYTNSKDRPAAAVFYGTQAKPVSHVYYRDETRREAHVAELFANRKAHADRMMARRGEQKAFAHSVKVGDIYRTSWGYDQTNVEFFEVTKLIGKKMCELREIASASHDRGQGSEICVPQSGSYLAPRFEGDDRGQPLRRLIQDRRIKIDDVRTGWPWGERVAGVIVGEPAHRTAFGWGH